MKEEIFSAHPYFLKVRYIVMQIRKKQMQCIHVFMARPVHYFGEGETFDKLWIFFDLFSISSFECQR